MPNYCSYSMCVKGTRENVNEFIKVIQAGYDYGSMEFDYDRHLFRVFEAYYETIEDLGHGLSQVIINGNCAWSVSSCMLDDHPTGYYNTLKQRYPNEFRGTTLQIESKNLNLGIEVFSEESGMCFQEHYVIINGNITVNECVDYNEYYLDEYETKEEAEEDLDIEITDEEWEEHEFISRGGFDNWDFEI